MNGIILSMLGKGIEKRLGLLSAVIDGIVAKVFMLFWTGNGPVSQRGRSGEKIVWYQKLCVWN